MRSPGALAPAEDQAHEGAAAQAMIAELDPFLDDLRTLRSDPPQLGDIPVSVISGTRPTRFDREIQHRRRRVRRR